MPLLIAADRDLQGRSGNGAAFPLHTDATFCTIDATRAFLVAVSFAPRPAAADTTPCNPDDLEDRVAFGNTIRQFDDYFAGRLTDFELPLLIRGDAFQLRVWNALRAIPYGCTATYGEIAEACGESRETSRAVGIACGQNPLPIVIPCHRVVGAGGKLTGFGGGLPAKRALLALEYRTRPPRETLFGHADAGLPIQLSKLSSG